MPYFVHAQDGLILSILRMFEGICSLDAAHNTYILFSSIVFSNVLFL